MLTSHVRFRPADDGVRSSQTRYSGLEQLRGVAQQGGKQGKGITQRHGGTLINNEVSVAIRRGRSFERSGHPPVISLLLTS
jgi:hypothetical protein